MSTLGVFGPWERWAERGRHDPDGFLKPGVYAIAEAPADWVGREFGWEREIIYFGMTNSKGGIRSRLRQFQNTIRGGRGHGGAARVRHHYRQEKLERDEVLERLLVAFAPFPCNVESNQPEDLREMGEVARFEYECMARYVKKYDKLPKFNDKDNYPKK